jgi:hypothetical protein
MSVFDEGKLRFDFDPAWSVAKYDLNPFYLDRVERLKGLATVTYQEGGQSQERAVELGTLAVDFLGVGPDECVHFIEVKDFRGHRIENKKRMKSNELAHEVARKVRDSLAGSIGAFRNATTPNALAPVASKLLDQSRPVFVILWLEDDLEKDPGRWKEEMHTLSEQIKSRLKWLTTKVLVVSRSTHAARPPALKVTGLPTT